MICERVLGICELWNNTLIVLLAPFDTKVVDLDIDSVLQLEEFDNISSAISDCSFSSRCWISKSYHVVGDICQIQVETILF